MALDKQMHFLVGVVVTLALGYLVNPLAAFIGGVVVGFLKETYDYYRPKFHTADVYDLIATGLGSLVASVFIIVAKSIYSLYSVQP